jgi:hypothetical protein
MIRIGLVMRVPGGVVAAAVGASVGVVDKW